MLMSGDRVSECKYYVENLKMKNIFLTGQQREKTGQARHGKKGLPLEEPDRGTSR